MEVVSRWTGIPVRRLGLSQRQRLLDAAGRLVFHGGMEDLSRFHTTLVRGGAW